MTKLKTHIPTVLIAMLFFAVVYRGPSNHEEARIWMEVFFEISLSVCLSAVIWNYCKWMSMFLLLTTFSTFWPSHGPFAYLAGKAVFNGCLWYYFIVSCFNVQNVNALYRIMRIITYFHVFIAVLQKSQYSVMFRTEKIVGLMSNPLELAAVIGFCLPAFLVLEKKKKLLFIVPFAGLIVAKQFLGFAAVGFGMIVYMWLRYNTYWPIVGVIVAGAVWWKVLDAPGIELRWFVWKKAVSGWLQYPVLGAGIGHWKLVFSKPMESDGYRWFTTHNEYLQMLFELGVGAAVTFVGYFTDMFRKIDARSIIPLTAMAIISVHCMANFTMHIAPTAMITMTWMGILTIHERSYSTDNRVYCGHDSSMGFE